ncbi:MAG: hypothetical protein QOK05_1346 [Chloroflexota bacterium]|nr:hypothetical protein [Chloroflexota bacterium]
MPRQQVRVQQRKIKPKAAQFEPPPPAKNRGALQARMLEGHNPKTVIRLSIYLAIYQAVLLILGIGLGLLLRPWPLEVEDALLFLLAIIVPGTLLWPALVLALRDRGAQVEMVQGQMVGASPVSMTYGLGMLYIKTRQGQRQLNIERRLLKSIPQNQVQVIARVTPNLHHVAGIQVMGPRMGAGVPSEIPEQFRSAEKFPLYAIGGAYAGVFGVGLVLLLLPLYGALLAVHIIVVPLGMAAAALAARYLTTFYQKRLQTSLEKAQ